MIILNENPPNIQEIRDAFNPPKGTIFTYGSFLYNPDKIYIDEPLLAHEEVHIRQQKEMGVKVWWTRYIGEPAFRASQEIEAYQVQFNVGKKLIKDRNRQALFLNRLAETLSSPMYGKCMTIDEAKKAIVSNVPMRFNVSLL